MSTNTDILKKTAFGVMAILFVINISTMANADKRQTAQNKLSQTNVDANWQVDWQFISTVDEIETLRTTAHNIQATQKELLEEIGRLESKIHTFESRQCSNAADQVQDSVTSTTKTP